MKRARSGVFFRMRALWAVPLLVTATAHAAPEHPGDVIDPAKLPVEETPPLISLDAYGKTGFGFAVSPPDRMTVIRPSYDFSLRFGKVFQATERLYPGGFVELHSLDLDTFDAAIGPQLTLRLGEQSALQVRGGIGTGSEGTHALAGVQVGTWMYGASVTARRAFGSGDVIFSANLEVTAVAVPVLLLAWFK